MTDIFLFTYVTNYGLFTVWTYRDNLYRHTGLLLDKRYIIFELLWESGLLAQIDPVLSARLIARSQTITDEISACPKDALLRWAVVLQDYTPDEAKNFLKGMKFDNHTLKRVCLLLEQLKNDVPTEAYPLRKLAGNIGEDAMRELLILLARSCAQQEEKADSAAVKQLGQFVRIESQECQIELRIFQFLKASQNRR